MFNNMRIFFYNQHFNSRRPSNRSRTRTKKNIMLSDVLKMCWNFQAFQAFQTFSISFVLFVQNSDDILIYEMHNMQIKVKKKHKFNLIYAGVTWCSIVYILINDFSIHFDIWFIQYESYMTHIMLVILYESITIFTHFIKTALQWHSSCFLCFLFFFIKNMLKIKHFEMIENFPIKRLEWNLDFFCCWLLLLLIFPIYFRP